MTRTSRAFLALLLTLLPALALAAGPQALSRKSGAPAELLGKTLAIARGLFALSLVVGLLVEAFSDSLDKGKSYGGVAWRASFSAELPMTMGATRLVANVSNFWEMVQQAMSYLRIFA